MMENPEILHLPRRFGHSNREPSTNRLYDDIIGISDTDDGYITPVQSPYPARHQKTNVSTSTRNNKKLIICTILGSLLTVLVVVPAVYFLTKSNYDTNTSHTCTAKNNFLLKLDRSTLNRRAFISENGLKLSNTYTKDTPVSSEKNPRTLSDYRGAIGNTCFDRNSKMYFEVFYEFSVVSELKPNRLIFEVGLAERRKVDNYFYVGVTFTKGWSYQVDVCNNTENYTCVLALHNNVYTSYRLNQSSQGSEHSGKFGFNVNLSQKKFSIVWKSKITGSSIVHSFRNVHSTEKLCPMFAVFNPDNFKVIIKLSNTFDFTHSVWNYVNI